MNERSEVTEGRETKGPRGVEARDRLVLSWGADGQLWAERGDRRAAVVVHRCFPWSDPSRYISLRGWNGEEFAFVRDTSELDRSSRAALESALAVAGFLLEITIVEDISEEGEVLNWVVGTRQGARRFQTRRGEWPVKMAGGGLLIHDLAGDIYHIPDPEALDPVSRKRLWPYAG